MEERRDCQARVLTHIIPLTSITITTAAVPHVASDRSCRWHWITSRRMGMMMCSLAPLGEVPCLDSEFLFHIVTAFFSAVFILNKVQELRKM
jgi:hypothetical protein